MIQSVCFDVKSPHQQTSIKSNSKNSYNPVLLAMSKRLWKERRRGDELIVARLPLPQQQEKTRGTRESTVDHNGQIVEVTNINLI